VATKRSGDRPGLTVTLRPADDLGSTPVPGKPFLTAASGALPREGNRRSKLQWRAMVDAAWDRPPIGRQSVFVDIDLNAYLSLKDLMKPIIDGLEPVLGHDPSGRLEFVPNDDLIIWLRVVRRVEGTPRLSPPGGVDGPRHALRVRVGLAA
jgi:hypothetical protein